MASTRYETTCASWPDMYLETRGGTFPGYVGRRIVNDR